MDDVLVLSRLQFALTIMFHYIFPPLTIGMGIVLVYLEGMFLKTRDPMYEVAAKFWVKIFALNFAIGVASGIVMEFQFGTNWAVYSRFVGDVFGSALAAEGIFAFFLESGFLGILVFGWDKVTPAFHFFSCCMVALGSIFSSIWIVIANCWQQTPAGSHIVQVQRLNPETGTTHPWFTLNEQGMLEPVMRAEVTEFWAMVFNPTTVDTLVHVWLGAFMMGAFFIMSISAWYLLKDRHVQFAKHSFRGALFLASVSSVLMMFSGDSNARVVAREQPAKLAAFEGHFENDGQPAGLYLFGIPNVEERKVTGVQIPYLLTFLVHRNLEDGVVGLNQFPEDQWPMVTIPFLAFHIMVGLGIFMLGICGLALFLLWRGKLWQTRWLLWAFVFAVVAPLIANQTGWIAAETGRQPWVVHPRVATDITHPDVLAGNAKVKYEYVKPPVIEAGTTIAITSSQIDEQTGMDIGKIEFVPAAQRIEPKETIAGLRTGHALSKSVVASQVLSSILMFGLIYILLGMVWIFVLNRKIKHGPDDPSGITNIGKDQFLDAAARRYEASMTDRKEILSDLPHTD